MAPDYKILSGAACQPQTGAQAGDFERYLHAIRNVSKPATPRTVICPIVRDTVKEYDLDVGVTVTTRVECKFFIMNHKGDPFGQPIEPSSRESVDVDRENQYFLVKANPEVDPFGYVGYYALQCTLPPEGQVFRFGAGELAESTDHNE